MENNNQRGPFGGDDLDPIVFVDSGDTPELREAALNLQRPTADDDEYRGPKISRREKLADEFENEEDYATEWVPNLEERNTARIINKAVEIIARIILALIPISLATVFILYSADVI